MAKVRTFSRRFPATHPRKGQPTYFVEGFLNSIGVTKASELLPGVHAIVNDFAIIDKSLAKHHTIRAGKHFKAGDFFSPRVWSESPYYSPQIKLAPDTLICSVWDIYLDLVPPAPKGMANGGEFFDIIRINGKEIANSENEAMVAKLAVNDGLSVEDFRAWFKKPFSGQIICWNPDIKY